MVKITTFKGHISDGHSGGYSDLDTKVNEFIKGKGIKVIDIKFSSTSSLVPWPPYIPEAPIIATAMVIYE